MREQFLTYSMNKVREQSSYDEDKLDEIRYGLEGIYILVTKSIVIFSIAIILHIFWELLLLLVFFNLLRMTGFGLHAKSSKGCLVGSTAVFIGLTLASKYISFSLPIRLAVSIICVINLAIFAPADTEKRPLVNKKKRIIYRLLTTIIAIIYTILQFIITDNFLLNSLVIGLLIESVLVNPLSYRLLGLRYNNYKYYNVGASE